MEMSPLQMLKLTSRTFFIPISRLEDSPRQVLTSYYLALRAIDQIEDHTKLTSDQKALILRNVSHTLTKYKASWQAEDYPFDWTSHTDSLPPVTIRLAEWIHLCPEDFRGRIVEATAAMADRMAFWAERGWKVQSEQDLDAYTYSVASSVGVTLSDIWSHLEGIKTDRNLAIAFGRGLQAVNILRNVGQDKDRGVSFIPPNWSQQLLIQYIHKNLEDAQKYLKSLPVESQAYKFCVIPYKLAKATVSVISAGKAKLSREQVESIVK